MLRRWPLQRVQLANWKCGLNPGVFSDATGHHAAGTGSKSASVQTGESTELRPYVVFRRENMPADVPPRNRCPSRGPLVHEREPRRRLAKNPVGEEMGCNAGRRSMLALDGFWGRSTKEVESRLVKHRRDLVVIPGGTTCVLQPSDVCLNKSFEAQLKRMYTEWIAQGLYEPMPMGRI